MRAGESEVVAEIIVGGRGRAALKGDIEERKEWYFVCSFRLDLMAQEVPSSSLFLKSEALKRCWELKEAPRRSFEKVVERRKQQQMRVRLRHSARKGLLEAGRCCMRHNYNTWAREGRWLKLPDLMGEKAWEGQAFEWRLRRWWTGGVGTCSLPICMGEQVHLLPALCAGRSQAVIPDSCILTFVLLKCLLCNG